MLKLPVHEDDTVLLRAVSRVINQKFSPKAIAAAVAASDEVVRQFPLGDNPLGFDTGDPALNRACKILRLLHIAELRHLQTAINELVVSVQAVTANPKTNTRLAKVGYG